MKMLEFRLKFHWSLFLVVQLTIFQHWFRYWLVASSAPSNNLNQWWLHYRRIYALLGLRQWVNMIYISIEYQLKFILRFQILLTSFGASASGGFHLTITCHMPSVIIISGKQSARELLPKINARKHCHPWFSSRAIFTEENGRHFADDIFKCILLNENCCIFIQVSLKFVPKGPNENNSVLVKVMNGLS